MEQELKDSTKSPGPLDLSISLESIEPDSPITTLPLNLMLTTVPEKQLSSDNPKPDIVKLMGLCPIHIVCARYYQAILLTEASEASVCCSGINIIFTQGMYSLFM